MVRTSTGQPHIAIGSFTPMRFVVLVSTSSAHCRRSKESPGQSCRDRPDGTGFRVWVILLGVSRRCRARTYDLFLVREALSHAELIVRAPGIRYRPPGWTAVASMK